MTQEEAYKFCYEHQMYKNDYDIIINVYKNTDSDIKHELRVACNDIYYYMDRDEYKDLKSGLKLAEDDFDIIIHENEI